MLRSRIKHLLGEMLSLLKIIQIAPGNVKMLTVNTVAPFFDHSLVIISIYIVFVTD